MSDKYTGTQAATLQDAANTWKQSETITQHHRDQFAAVVRLSHSIGISNRTISSLTGVHMRTLQKMINNDYTNITTE